MRLPSTRTPTRAAGPAFPANIGEQGEDEAVPGGEVQGHHVQYLPTPTSPYDARSTHGVVRAEGQPPSRREPASCGLGPLGEEGQTGPGRGRGLGGAGGCAEEHP